MSSLLGSSWESSLRGHIDRIPLRHQLPVDRGDTEAREAQGYQDVLLQGVQGDGVHSTQNLRYISFRAVS